MKEKNYSFLAIIKKTIPLFLIMIFVNVGWGQTWNYDFGTGTGTFASTTFSTTFLPSPTSGTARVRVGTNPGSFVLANPGLTGLGTGSELQMTSNTGSTSTTKFSIFDYTTSKLGYVKFKIAMNGGTNGVYYLTIGDGATFSDNNAIANGQTFAGLKLILGASNTVSYEVLNNTTYGTTGITTPTTLFTQGTSNVYQIEIYYNNETISKDYTRSAGSNSLAAAKWDLWVNGTLVGNDLSKGALATNSNIDSFAFNHQVSATTPGTIYLDDIEYSNALPLNTVPTVSNVSITGLPNTTVQLTGTYDYADTESDVDASTYKWYTATDGFGANATAIGGATAVNYTLTATELGKYIRFGVTAAAGTGTSPGAEAFSSWIGPVNSAGTPVLNAGLLADFNATCINTTSDANSFTLMGNNLTGDVTVGALSGFAFSTTENGTYTSTLTISPVSEGIDVIVYVKFTPTTVQPYNGNITISGGGATSVDVSAVASGINTAVSAATGMSDAFTSNSATLNGSFTKGCSTVTAYGIEYSTTSGFANGAGTSVASTNVNAGNFTSSVSGLQSNTTYYYKAYATDATGTVYGTQSSFMTEVIADPTATAATAVTPTGFTANWNAVSGATGYELDVYQSVGSVSEVINETFTWSTNSTGGNDDIWSGSIATGTIGAGDLTGWSITASNKANNCIKAGSSSNLGIVTTPELNFSGSGVLTFRAGAWNGGSEQTTLKLEISGGGTLNISQVTMVKGAFTDFTVNISDATTLTKITFKGFQASSSRFFLDDVKIMAGTMVITPADGYPDLAVMGTSKVITGLSSNTQYFYVVRAKDATSTSISSNEIAVTTLNGETTYTAGAWTNGTPTADLDAIIDDNYTTTGNLTAKSLTINSDKVFTVATGNTLTVANAITNNAGVTGLVIESDAVLLQTSTAANTTASATVKRNSNSLFRQDYTLWSSPVFEPNLRNFSPNTVFNRFYSYDYTSGIAGAYKQEIVTGADVTNKTFGLAKGYLIRMPNITSPVVDGYENYTTELVFNGEFKGNLNNGTITTPLYGDNATSNGYTLVGNPYPSPINISNFLTDNSQIIGSLYFWRKKNSFLSPSGSGYVTYNIGTQSLVGVGNNVGINGGTLTHINTGQGFLVKTDLATPTDLVFNNTMRESASTIFFKSTPDATPELNRFWLDLSYETNLVGQTLVAYATDATEGVDGNFDSLYINDSPLALTSIINNDEYIIQAKSLPFLTSDVVSLGFKTDIAGSFTIALSNFDGLFAENQAIYLKDKLNNTLHNLKAEAYTFTSPVGVFNDRFEVKYEGALGTNNPVALENNILIAVKNQQIKINAGTVTMDKVELIDVAGRIIYTLDGVNATTVTVENVPATNQILIVKISTKENGVVTQKIIF